jgi:hypothetical protein
MAALGNQLLDQLGAGSLVLDQHLDRTEQALLLAHRALERRVFEPPAMSAALELEASGGVPLSARATTGKFNRLRWAPPSLIWRKNSLLCRFNSLIRHN